MEISRALIATVFAVLLAGGAHAAGATDANPLVGSWVVKHEASGPETTFWFAEDVVIKGPDQPPVPYWYERDGDVFTLVIGEKDEPPATLTFHTPNSAELRLADGLSIQLTRLEEPGAPGSPSAPTDASSGQGASDTLPLGVPTRYEPLGQSLESLLAAGWQLEQVSGAQNRFTILLTNGERNALCVLVPQNQESGAMALSDCRRLN